MGCKSEGVYHDTPVIGATRPCRGCPDCDPKQLLARLDKLLDHVKELEEKKIPDLRALYDIREEKLKKRLARARATVAEQHKRLFAAWEHTTKLERGYRTHARTLEDFEADAAVATDLASILDLLDKGLEVARCH